ncbi:MAG: hypothetical protein ACOZCL_17560 [Bacillota bacterium]
MGDKAKKLCKQIKDDILKDNPENYREHVKNPTHICMKCGRASNNKKLLCKPEEL